MSKRKEEKKGLKSNRMKCRRINKKKKSRETESDEELEMSCLCFHL